jgi:hypothetical protein
VAGTVDSSDSRTNHVDSLKNGKISGAGAAFKQNFLDFRRAG